MEDELDYIQPNKAEHIFLTEEFNKCCPFYLSIGMTYEQFWYGDPTMAKDYLKAYKLKEKREAEKAKWIMWEQGLYVYEAICDVSPVLRAFSKATKPLPYPKKPWDIDETQMIENEKIKKLREERDIYKTQIFFQNWANTQKEHFRNKK